MNSVNNRIIFWQPVAIAFTALLFSGCKTPPSQTALDVAALMSEGNCSQIEGFATKSNLSPDEKGALAVCSLVTRAAGEGESAALNFIVDQDEKAAKQNIAAMLSMATLYPSPAATFRPSVVEVVFGAGGYGPHKQKTPIIPKSETAQEVVIAVVHFTLEMYFHRSPSGNLNDLFQICEGCKFLLGDSFVGANDYLAWQLHTALAEFALFVWDPLNKTEFGFELMGATISVIEQNRGIAVAARCDLSAPYEQLKSALSKDTSLLGPLERAVSVAMGCTRGRYAPAPPTEFPQK